MNKKGTIEDSNKIFEPAIPLIVKPGIFKLIC